MRSHDLGATERVEQASPLRDGAAPEVWLPALGHLAVGYAIALRAARSPRTRSPSLGLLLVLVVAVAVIPDLDIPAAELGLAEHRGGSHSLVMAAVMGGVVAVIARWRKQSALLWGAAAAVSMASHGVLDLFSQGPGVKLLWPFTDARFASSVRPLPTPHVFQILSPHELLVLAAEVALFAPVVLFSWVAARRSARRRHMS